LCQRKGIAHAKAHAQMFRLDDFHDLTLYYKVSDVRGGIMFKDFSLRLVLPDDLLEHVNIAGEGFPARRRQGAGGEGAFVGQRFVDGHKPALLKRANVGGEVTIGHPQGLAQFGELQARGGGEHGHDGQAALLMDDPVKLEKRFGVHNVGPRFSVKYR
jgi:hypothetical protein